MEDWEESSTQIYDCTGKYFDYDFVRQVQNADTAFDSVDRLIA